MRKVFASLFVRLLCLDMGMKQYIEENFKEREERETAAERIVLRKVYNGGFLLNMLDDCPEVIRGSSAVLGGGILLYDLWLFFRPGRWFRKLGMTFLTAGAVSNTYDRLARGKVVDYIGIRSSRKLLGTVTANLADFYLAVGAVMTSLAGRR